MRALEIPAALLIAGNILSCTPTAPNVSGRDDVILLEKTAEEAIVRKCEEYLAQEGNEACRTTAKTPLVRTETGALKQRLREALAFPEDFTPRMKESIRRYRAALRNPNPPPDRCDDASSLERLRGEASLTLRQIESFAASFAPHIQIKKELDAIEEKLADIGLLMEASRELNQLLGRSLDGIFAVSRFQVPVPSTNVFIYGALKSYFAKPAFSARFARLNPGTFVMGSPSSEKGRLDNETQHSVTLTEAFEIQETQVTQLQWLHVMGGNPAKFQKAENCPGDFTLLEGVSLCPNHPVETVSWYDVQEFLAKLNQLNDGFQYRLPTEAEREYAARGGTKTAFFFGDDPVSLDEFAWYGIPETKATASRKPNPYGLYDVYGNVWEWTQDWYAPYPAKAAADPKGPASGRYKVLRGGGMVFGVQAQRSAKRGIYTPQHRNFTAGFRLVRKAAASGAEAFPKNIARKTMQDFADLLRLPECK